MGADFGVDGYELIGLLVADESGELWDARELSTGSRVALRRLTVGGGSAQDKARRLVSVLGRVGHPGLLRVREVIPRESELVVVLDPAERGDLTSLLLLRGRLDPGEVATIGSAAASALAALHGHGLVHGGVTTSAICFDADGQPLVAEPAIDPDDAIPAGDVRGLATVCYTALTGVPLDEPRRPLPEVAPGVPAALAHAVEAGLADEPADRPSMTSFGAQLRAAVQPTPVRFGEAPFLSAPVMEPSEPSEPPEPDDERDEPERRSRSLGLAIGLPAAALLLVLAAVFAGWWLLRSPGSDSDSGSVAEWMSVMKELDQNRAAAWERLDPALLSLVHPVGSEPFKAEQADMETFRSRGVVSAQGVATPISSLEVRSVSDERVVLDVVSRIRPYVVTYQDGRRFRVEPKEPAKQVRIELVPDGSGGWLISKSTELK
jgi:serine/threonine protein kinase